jgi:hypothetical protein
MDNSERHLAKQWESVLRRFFPGVVVKAYVRQEDEDALPLFDVFFIPNDKRMDFVHFLMKDRRRVARENNLERVLLVPHTVAETEEHYPDVWRAGCEHKVVSVDDNDVSYSASISPEFIQSQPLIPVEVIDNSNSESHENFHINPSFLSITGVVNSNFCSKKQKILYSLGDPISAKTVYKTATTETTSEQCLAA